MFGQFPQAALGHRRRDIGHVHQGNPAAGRRGIERLGAGFHRKPFDAAFGQRELIDGYGEADLTATLAYQTTSGKPYSQPRQDILLHLFNHQTHHRGHAHACCSIVTGKEPPTLDLLMFQRGMPAPTLPV